jgi:hypothetical protein
VARFPVHYTGSTGYFCVVNSSGAAYNLYAAGVVGVVPAFCIW